MTDPSEANQAKQDYLEVLKTLLNRIKQAGEIKGFDPSKDISIHIGAATVYEGSIGQEPTKNKMTNESIKLLDKAISEPQNLSGSVKIKIGKNTVYHAKDGEVKTDILELSQSQKQTPLAQEELKTINSVEDLTEKIETLQQKIQEQQEVIDSLKSQPKADENIASLTTEFFNLKETLNQQQSTFEKLTRGLENITSRPTPEIKNTALQNWVGSVETAAKNMAARLGNEVKAIIAPKVELARSNIESQLNEIKQNVSDLKSHLSQQINDGVQAISSSILEIKGKAIEASVGTILKIGGNKNTDGSVSLDTKNYHFHQQGNTITIKSIEDGREILTNGKLSPSVSDQEIKILEQVQPIAEQLSNSVTQTEAPHSRLKR